MRQKLIFIGGLTAIFALSACGTTNVLERERPDEFAASRAEPLSVPADFTLPAPQPGAARVQKGTTQQQMLDAMFGTPAPK